MREFLQKEVTFSIFLKFMVALNLVALAICFRFAYTGDIEEAEEQEYITYLEERVETQSELIELQRRIIYGEWFERLNDRH